MSLPIPFVDRLTRVSMQLRSVIGHGADGAHGRANGAVTDQTPGEITRRFPEGRR